MIYGLTLESLQNIGGICSALEDLHWRVYARVRFDIDEKPEVYVKAMRQLSDAAVIVGQVVHPRELALLTLDQYTKRTFDYVNTLSRWVPVWEIGNKANRPGGECIHQKIAVGHDIVRSFGRHSAITLDPSKEMFEWARELPKTVRNTIPYVFVSMYEDDYDRQSPRWGSVYKVLGEIFPHSYLGVGECGTMHDGRKAALIRRYYSLKLSSCPRFIGGFFWLTGTEDLTPRGSRLWEVLNQTLKEVAE